jgi:hypothetical protein
VKKIFGIVQSNLMLILALIFITVNLQSQTPDDYLVGRDYWVNEDYQKAYEHLIRYRETTYGRNVEVDYMLGTSGCRLPDPEMKKWGCDVLDWVLRRYDLSNKGKLTVLQQLELCQSATVPPLSEASLANITARIGASASVWGSKMYYWISRNESFNNYRAVFLREIPRDSLRARIFPLNDSINARQQIHKQFPKAKVFISNRIIFTIWTGHNNEVLKKIAQYLEIYLNFLERYYDIKIPSEYITIYLVSNSDELQKLSAKLHGVRMSRTVFGYSFRDDLSIVAAVPEGFTIGTMMHELFHLVVRSTFGDIPLWLDEGIASLYEVAKFEGEEVLGMTNWRGKLLKELTLGSPIKRGEPDIWPSLAKLITSNWFALEQPEKSSEGELDKMPSARQLAAMLATARYFALYAQEKGKLSSLYFAFQKWEPGNDDPGATYERKAIQRVENVFVNSINSIDHDFRSWFNAIPTNN